MKDTLRDLVMQLNLPEPEYGLELGPGLHLPLAYPDERAGLAAAGTILADVQGWRLFAFDTDDPASVRGALLALAAALGWLEPGTGPAAPAPGPDPVEAETAVTLEAPPRARPGAPPGGPALTPQQLAAVGHGAGPARVLAGAGTGKTTVVVSRFRHLVGQGAAPERILVLTFSREAARSLRDAILPGLRAAGRLWISTFHSFCLRLLEEEGAGGLRLLSEPESRAILAGLVAGRPWRWYAGGTHRQRLVDDAVTFIGQAKDHLLTPADVARFADHTGDERLADLADAYELFQTELTRLQAAEFADYISLAVGLLERDPALAQRWQDRFDHILADEFQDANVAQFRVLQILARPHGNLMVVGDDDQAIYRFRGATDKFMVDFPRYVPGAVTYPVAENFRCPQPVLGAANALISGNAAYRVAKQLYTTTKTDGYPPVRHWEARSEREEEEAAAAYIAGCIRSGERGPGDFAILCRSVRRTAPEFARALAARGVPCRQVGTEAEHPVVAQTLALLRLTRTLTNEDLLQVLASRVPAPDLYAAVRESGGDLTALAAGGAPAAVPGSFQTAAQALTTWLETHRHRPLPTLVYEALRWLGHLELSLTPHQPELERIAAARSLQERAAGAPDLDALLAHSHASDLPTPGDAVTLMTVHAAKGLQFPVVFVAGLAEGRFPVQVEQTPVFYLAGTIRDWLDDPAAYRAPGEAERLQWHIREERRLLYVALTRAEQELIVTRARQYGSDPVQPSRFLLEMQAPAAEPVSLHLADPVAEARAYLLGVADRQELPDPGRVSAAVLSLSAEPAAVPLRRQAPPAPFAPDESLTLSATALETYKDCPRKYYYSQVLRLPDEDNIYLAFGDAVHKTLERYHLALKAGAAPEWANVSAWWAEALDRARCETEGQYRQLLLRGETFLHRYSTWAQHRWQQILAVEERFRFTYTDRAGRSHTVNGRYDLVAIGPNGLEIIDFKTGKRNVNKRRSNSDNDPERKLQLGLYYLARFGTQIEPGARVTYIFLRHPDDKAPADWVETFDQKGEQVISCAHTAQTLEAIRGRVDEIIDGILANRFDRTADESKCRTCPFRQPCEVTPLEWF